MDQQKIGEKLKTLRKERQLTQEELAEKLYVSSKTVSRWENGTNLPDISTLLEIADLYGVDIREILLCERKREIMNNEIKDVAIKVADYSNKDKEETAKRNIIASIVGIATFVIGLVLMIYGSGILSLVALASLSAALGSLTYILINSTKKHDEANRKKGKGRTVLFSVLIAVIVLIWALIAISLTWFE